MDRRHARTTRRLIPGLLALALGAIAPARAQTIATPPATPAARPRIDLVFVLDATASMGDEIEPVKQHLWAIASRVASGRPAPDLRVGLVVYRDRGDREPSRVVPLTRDLDAMHTALMRVEADGGGDQPEDVDTGLALALREMNWDRGAAKMMFVVGDASAQNYPERDREALIREARERQIEVSTIECSGMDAPGHAMWQMMAERTSGLAQVLTYAQDQRMADGSTRTVMTQGANTWVANRALTAAEREEDAEVLARRGVLRAARPSEVETAGPTFARRHTREGVVGGVAAGAPAAAPTNNIASQITRRVQQRAADMGVAY
jgi:Mg-chelatase subunit ChlD